MQKVYFKTKCFCFWKQKRRRGDREMTKKLIKQGWHLPCEPEQAEWNISLHLGKNLHFVSVSNKEATSVCKWEEVGTAAAHIYNYLKKLRCECWKGERNPWDHTDGNCVQSYLRNSHKFHSLYHFKKKIELSVERRVQGLIVLQI